MLDTGFSKRIEARYLKNSPFSFQDPTSSIHPPDLPYLPSVLISIPFVTGSFSSMPFRMESSFNLSLGIL